MRLFEENYIAKTLKAPSIINDCNVNLRKDQKRKLCKKYRNILNEGILIENVQLYHYHHNNNKLMILIIFKVKKDKAN